MSKSKILLLIIMMNIFCLNMVYASDILPIVDTFDGKAFEGLKGFSVAPLARVTPEHYVRVQNDKLVLSVGAYNNIDSWAYKTLDTPFVFGRIVIEYTASIGVGSTLVSYHGMSSMYDSDGVASYGLVFYGGQIKFASKLLKDTSLAYGTEYKVKIILNMNEKYYELYINDEKKYATDGTGEFTYNGKDLKKIGFNITSSTNGGAKVYLDNLNIHSFAKQIFISKNGNDSNAGTFDEPVKTIEKAVWILKNEAAIPPEGAFIYLMDGEYEIPNGLIYGEANISTVSNTIPIYPLDGADIKLINNNSAYAISEIDKLSIHSQYKADIAKKINNEYIGRFPILPALLSDMNVVNDFSDNSIKVECFASNNSSISYRITIISSLYDKDNKLSSVIMNKAIVKKGAVTDLSFKHPTYFTSAMKHKIFIWDDIAKLSAIKDIGYIGDAPKNSNFVNLCGNILKINDDGIIRTDDVLTIKGVATCDAFITAKVVDHEGVICGLEQICVQAGEFTLNCKSLRGLDGKTITVSGGAIGE